MPFKMNKQQGANQQIQLNQQQVRTQRIIDIDRLISQYERSPSNHFICIIFIVVLVVLVLVIVVVVDRRCE